MIAQGAAIREANFSQTHDRTMFNPIKGDALMPKKTDPIGPVAHFQIEANVAGTSRMPVLRKNEPNRSQGRSAAFGKVEPNLSSERQGWGAVGSREKRTQGRGSESSPPASAAWGRAEGHGGHLIS